MTIVVKTLTPAEIQTATLLANQIANAATRTVTASQFVYFAAFDGTRNDRDNLPLSGLPLSTNAAQLFEQVRDGNQSNPNVATGYFRGVGTNGVVDPTAAVPTSEVKARAEEAYISFNKAASDWLVDNPGGEVRAMLASFSRGGSIAATFSQILFERGIVDPLSQQVLVAPGTSLISGGVIMDTVNTGVSTNAAFLGASNLVFTTSDNEYRYAFRGLDNSGQIGSAGVFNVFGNHVDGGGGRDRGLGALVLGGADGLGGSVGYFSAKGLTVAPTPADRLFDPTQAVVHSEGKDSFGNIIWSEYGSIEAGTVRLFQNGVIAPVTQYNPNGGVQNSYLNTDGQRVVNLVEPGIDGGTKRTFTIQNADTGQVLAQTEVEISADKNTQTIATYNLQNQTWLEITYVKTPFDDGSYLYSSATPDGKVVVKGVDTDGQLAGTFTDTPDPAGNITRTIATTVDGQPVEITQHASAASLANGEQTGDFATSAVTINGQPAINPAIVMAALDDINALDILLARGPVAEVIGAGDPTNPSPSLAVLTGRPDWWNDPTIGALASDTVSLISALRSGRPLPIASAGFNFASHNFSDPAVAEIATALAGVSSLASLVGALEKGDLGRIFIDGGGVARSALTIYSNSLTQQMISQYGSVAGARFAIDAGDEFAVEIIGKLDGAGALLQGLGQVIAVLNIFNSLANGDIKGAVIAAAVLYFQATGPLIGAILTAIDFVATLIFEHKRDFEADGRFVVNGAGVITAEIGEVNGGGQHGFYPWMNRMLQQTQEQALEIGKINGQPMGIIAERLPVVTFKRDAMFLRYDDPLTPGVGYKTFDFDGKYLSPGSVEDILHAGQTTIFRSPWGDAPENPFVNRYAAERDWQPGNQVALADNFFDSLARQYSDAVTASGAIAPLWEVETVNRQRQTGGLYAGYQYAGQTTEQIAAQSSTKHYDWHIYYNGPNSSWYGTPGDARPGNLGIFGQPVNATSQQTATVITLDLNGDGVITTTRKATGSGVLFDVDNDGFAEETDWIGPRDGILVLDRTSSGQPADGQINRGADLFNDTWVDGTRRRLSVLNEIDDGFAQAGINNIGGEVVDPVFRHLKVWLDINGDGVAQDAELRGLTELGITSLNWDSASPSAIGSFTQNGQTRLMQSVNLQADAAGVATVQVGNSLLVEKEVGGRDLYATAVIDYGASTNAAVRAAHSQTSANGVLTVTDEVLDGQEDTAITVSIAQLLKNDRSISGAVSFAGLPNSGQQVASTGDVGGYAQYDLARQTITFTPNENFNGVASFVYSVQDGQGNRGQATAYIDIGAVDDAPTIEVKSARRQAGWRDLVITSNAQGNSVYAMAPMILSPHGQMPANPVTQVSKMGYLGNTATSLQPDSVGILGFSAGKLYYAALAEVGNAATQMDWWEVWVDPVDGASSGTITVSDVDNQSLISIGIEKRINEPPRDGQFGNTTVIDNQNGTASFSYTRTSLWSQPARSYLSGFTDSFDGFPVYVPFKAGPDDAFSIEIKQASATPGKTIDSYEKVIVKAGNASELRAEDEYLTLVDGAFQPPADPEPFNAFPIVLDLNDNGFRFIAKDDSSAFYDLAGDGVRRATAWTSGQDALLAFDANNDGRISGKAEISFKDYLPGAATDLAGLAAFDTNADGVFSSADAQWGKFRVWQDKNDDGIQTADELSTLAQRGIASINLTSNNLASSASGVTVHGIGSYTRIDGTQAQLADAQFAYTSETLSSVSDDTVDLNVNPVAQLSTGGGDDAITGSANADKINAGTGHDFVMAGGGDDLVIGGAGNDQIGGGEGADTLWGGKGADRLAGDAGADLLYGGSGDDYLSGGADNDALWGGTGNDVTSGGAGMDTYHFALGDGNDLIRDMAEASGAPGMRIVLGTNAAGQSINPQNIQVEALEGGSGYVLRFSATDSLTVQNLGATALTTANVQLALADGTLLNLNQLMAATHVNHAPTLAAALTGQSANQGNPWSYTVPAGTFADVDAGDSVSLSATLANGDPLPIWLRFNATTGTFSGTPPAVSVGLGVGDFAIEVLATDAFGLKALSSFNLVVGAPVNRAPTVANALTPKTVNEDSLWTYTVPATTFADPDVGDTMHLSATLANGNPLPSWLSFNAATRTFSGTPLNAHVGGLAIKVVATDALGLSTSSTFDVQVANTNDAPSVNTALTSQSAVSGQAFSYAIPITGASAAFADQDVGDVLTLSAKLANGNLLPSWLSFDAATGVFSGTQPSTSVGSLSLQVIATDIAGASVSSAFALAVQAAVDTGGPTPPPGALVGTPGKDVLTASSAHTEVWGLAGDDIINGFWGNTRLVGGAGNDTINAVGGCRQHFGRR